VVLVAVLAAALLAAGILAAAVLAAAVLAAAVLAAGILAAGVAFVADAVLGTTLRAIGRDFGSGTFAAAEACVAGADSPMASTRPVANTRDKAVDRAVDRKAAARVEITAFLRGESSIAML
jgi:hypothetical protein